MLFRLTMIYVCAVGSYDWICNWVGNERWTLALEWSGQEEFRSQKLREWTVGGVKAGVTRSAKNGLFTFATVDGAGHMVCLVPYLCYLLFLVPRSLDFVRVCSCS